MYELIESDENRKSMSFHHLALLSSSDVDLLKRNVDRKTTFVFQRCDSSRTRLFLDKCDSDDEILSLATATLLFRGILARVFSNCSQFRAGARKLTRAKADLTLEIFTIFSIAFLCFRILPIKGKRRDGGRMNGDPFLDLVDCTARRDSRR